MGSGSTIRISAVGDIALNGGYHQLASTGNARTLAGAIAPMFADSDVAIGNLEGPLTTRPAVAPPSHFTLRGDPSYASILRDAGFTVLSLANNHMMDYGWEGLQETCSHLDAVGIRYVGAGKNLREARHPLHLCIRGLKLAVLAYCDVSILAPVYADVDRPGIAPARPSYILEDIAATKPHSDVVIVCMHWGQEHVHYPAPKYRQLAGEMIRAGASLIIGHHPHVLQGAARIADGAVSYSLGNFTFSEELWQGRNSQDEAFAMPYRLNESARRAAIWNVSVDRRGRILQETLVPTYLRSNLLPALDQRPQRQTEINQYRQALSTNVYGLFWAIRMIASRLRVISREVGGDNGIAGRLVRIRPRHLRDMRRLLVREWEQLRGME